MRDRLIDILAKSGASFEYATPEDVADHLLSEGVIVTDFRNGDVVYQLAHGYAEEERVRCVGVEYLTNGYSFFPQDIGKTVFLTREEAERALERSE